MKKLVTICLTTLCTSSLLLGVIKKTPLTDPILREIDGLPGLVDKTKIESTLWLIKEIKNIHNGFIKLSAQGIPDPSRASKIHYLTFRNERQTIKTLIELEKHIANFSAAEKEEFDILFKMVKEYFGKINAILLADAQGAQEFMIKLINEFCRKRDRLDSLLLNWKKGSSETEMYNASVSSFRIFHILSNDLMNFLADFVMSCPKALKDYHESLKK